MKLDYNKFVKILGLIGLGVGVLLVLASFFITPIFVANHFSPDSILGEDTIRRLQSVRFSAAVSGIFTIVFGALIYIYPSTVNRFFDFVSLKGERIQTRHFYLPFCFACFFIALMLGLLITQSGSGISPDSTGYISAGENVYYGNGFYVGYSDRETLHPYTAQSPLYPLSIAAFMHLGFNAEQAARLVPILCFAFLMFPLFYLGKVLDGVFTGYIACLMCLVFTSLLWVTSYAWTEMPYIFFSVLTIFFLVNFAKINEAKSKILCVSGFFAALAILTKYIGVTLLLVGLIVILLKSKSQLKKMVYQILLFGSISFLPIIPWVYRNITLASRLSGSSRGESTVGLLTNVNMTVLSILYDFLGGPPHVYFNYVGLAIIAALFILLIVFAKIYPAKRKLLLEYFRKNYIYIVSLYIFVYLITLIIMRSMWHFDEIGTRLTCPVYPFLILVVISFILYVHRQKKDLLRPNLLSVITILCVLFFVIQTSFSMGFYQYAKDGQGYNSPFWRNNQGISWVESNVPDNATVYSDSAGAIQFRLKRPSRYLPRAGNDKAINEFFEKLKNEENSFIICFNKARISLLSNDEIVEMNQKYDVLVVVADFPESTIYKTKDNPC